jgi:hypothetical protein
MASGSSKSTVSIPKGNLLWHYTSQAGLIGIAENNNVWATNIFYMNDGSEYRYAAELILAVIDSHIEKMIEENPSVAPARISEYHYDDYPPENRPPLGQNLISDKLALMNETKRMFQDIQNIEYANEHPFYIQSFTEKFDDLSQWRGYCPKGNGFCIGFRCDILIELAGDGTNDMLVDCIYHNRKQVEKTREVISESLSSIDMAHEKGDAFKDTIFFELHILEAVVSLMNLIPQFKHPSFHEETEWRLVYKPEKINDIIHHRPGNSMIIPCIKTGLIPSEAIAEVIVGPTLHPELSKKSTESFLKSKGIHCTVSLSKVPYRML